MDNFNGLTHAEAERLAMLAEEAGEIVQAVGKVLRHGYGSQHPNGGPDNRETLERELGDLAAVVQMMERAGEITAHVGGSEATARKLRYAHHQSAI